MKSNEFQQLSMFEVIPGHKDTADPDPEGQISITRMKYLSSEYTTYEEVFRGYHELRVLTYSYSLPFVEEIMKYFDYGEVIIGFHKLVNPNAAELFAMQEYSTNYICSNSYLQKRIQKNELRFYVLHDLGFISHQKVYLLKADDGRVRTITGSANFSKSAWTDDQLECITVCDDPECYQFYKKQYDTLLQLSTDEIAQNAIPILENGENADELPILKKIEQNHAVVIRESQNPEDCKYAFQIGKLAKTWENRLHNLKINPSENGKILLEIKHVKAILNAIKKDNTLKKEQEFIYPQLQLDFNNHTAVFNQRPFDLTPDDNDISSDLKNLLEYMDGFDLFTKDTDRLKTSYWKVLNYMFLSPFLARLRYEGAHYGYEERFFPIYLLIYGDSDAGKTKFIEFVHQLMFQEKLGTLSTSYFTKKGMTLLKTELKGCPILIDELTSTYWKYAKDIVKLDSFLIDDCQIHHPAFILLSNDINNIPPELSKRVILISLDNRLDRAVAAYNGKRINTLRKNTGNALYREYLRRMFPTVENLIIEMQTHDSQNDNDWIPDIFEKSSCLLTEIMQDFQINIPKECSIFTWFDYMGDDAIGEKATTIIQEEYFHNSRIFKIFPAKNEVEIDFSCYDDREAKKKLRILHDELPANIECKIIGSKAVLRLDAITKHSGINFKKRLFWRLKS